MSDWYVVGGPPGGKNHISPAKAPGRSLWLGVRAQCGRVIGGYSVRKEEVFGDLCKNCLKSLGWEEP